MLDMEIDSNLIMKKIDSVILKIIWTLYETRELIEFVFFYIHVSTKSEAPILS